MSLRGLSYDFLLRKILVKERGNAVQKKKLSKKALKLLSIFVSAAAVIVSSLIGAYKVGFSPVVNLFAVFNQTIVDNSVEDNSNHDNLTVINGSFTENPTQAVTGADNPKTPSPAPVTTSPTTEPATPTPALPTAEPATHVPSPTPEPIRWLVKLYNEPDGEKLYCIWYFEYDEAGNETGKLVINGYTGVDFTGDLIWIYEGGFTRDENQNVKPHGDSRTFYWNKDNNGHFDYAEGEYADGKRVGTRTYWVLSGVVQPSGQDKEREPVLTDEMLTGVLREGAFTKSDS